MIRQTLFEMFAIAAASLASDPRESGDLYPKEHFCLGEESQGWTVV